jgi:LPS-assembly lipoprotein
MTLFAALALSGCGFHSVYGSRDSDDSPIAAQMQDVAIDNIKERNGQMLRNDLIDMMYGKGRPTQPRYRLTIDLKASEEDLGIQADATTTRAMINMVGNFVLKDAAGKELMHGTAHSTSNINKISNQYATLVSNQDAYARTINEVSQQIVNRLSLYFAERDRQQPVASP